MEKQIALTEAREKFSEMVNEVMYQGDTYIISKQGKPAVAVVPLDIWTQWQKQRDQQFTIIDEIQAQNADSEIAQWDEDTLLETISGLVHEIRATTTDETSSPL
ncbi:MAG: type II toxin-antitoxin system prevent-host-death family antitoxin [Caldilineaceae bacterium]